MTKIRKRAGKTQRQEVESHNKTYEVEPFKMKQETSKLKTKMMTFPNDCQDLILVWISLGYEKVQGTF